MTAKDYIEIIAVLTSGLGFALIMAHRFFTKKAVGARTIQISTVVLMFPIILILGLEKTLESSTIGTLLGGIAGFVLARVGEYVPGGNKEDKDDDDASKTDKKST